MIGTLAVIIVFGALIFFHELGHFCVARSFGMGVKTFSLGFGPALFSFKRGQTLYQVAAVPLGGFVALVGESATADMPEGFTHKDSFSLRPAWQRFLVIAAGPVFNLVLAWIICWGLMYAGGRNFIPPVVGEVLENSAAAQSPLEKGDRILSIDGVTVSRWLDIPPLVQRGQGKSLVIVVEKPDLNTVVFSIAPTQLTQTTADGEVIESWGIGIRAGEAERQSFGFVESAREGMFEAANMVTYTWRALTDLVTRQVAFDNVGGPILIAQAIYKQADHGLLSVLMIAALISVNLGILNLLPVPVLDGGHLIFLMTEMLVGKPVPARVQEKAMLVGLFLLLGLMVAATFNDVMRFF
ncbi:RIP metalloprotease RseP [Desulfovibrio sp. OttesenSCG-928-M14]|nr:RIP metalloprotease RseP [Desulfovibrio sp. OttesenSCG-928-M14]